MCNDILISASPEGVIYKNENGIYGESEGYAQLMCRDIVLEFFYAEDLGRKQIRLVYAALSGLC